MEQTWGQLNSGIVINGQFQFQNWLFGIDKFWIGISFKKYLEYKLFGLGIPSRYLEYLIMVKCSI